MATIITENSLKFGALPRSLLQRSRLSPMARLLWAVLDGCGRDQVKVNLAEICRLMGFSPRSKGSVITYTVELVKGGFLEVSSGRGRKVQVGSRGFKWDENEYSLALPLYCKASTPKELKIALEAAVEANLGAWAPALGEDKATARRRRYRDRQKAKSHASTDAAGNASTDAAGNASTDAAGNASTDESGLASTDAIKALNTSLGGNLAGSGPPPKEFHNAEKTPAGWEGWGQLYFEKYDHRHIWTGKERAAAIEICDSLLQPGQALDVEELKQIQKNFLDCTYWGPRKAPLDRLAAHLLDYMPAKNKRKLNSCSHASHLVSEITHAAEILNGVSGQRTFLNFPCGHVVAEKFTPDPTDEELQLLAAFNERRKKAGLEELPESLAGA